MKGFILFVALLVATQLHAQVTGVSIQASGLTCSMCSNAIRKSLLSVAFVSEVKANIRQSSFDLTFKPNASVDFDLLKKKVEDAGFFVASFQVTAQVDHLAVLNNRHVNWEGYSFHFLKVKDQALNGTQSFRILDKGFVSAKEFKKNHALTSLACYDTGIAGSCCEADHISPGKRVYHVTF